VGKETPEGTDASKLYIGEVTVASGAVSDYHARQHGDTFISQWEDGEVVDITAGTGIESFEYYHGLNSEYLDVSVQVCATIGGSVEVLGFTSLTYGGLDVSIDATGLGVSKTGTVVYTAPTVVPAVLVPNTPQILSGGYQSNAGGVSDTIAVAITGKDTVTGELTGNLYTNNAVRIKWDKNRIWVKNAASGKFYKSFGDVVVTSGYIRVIVRRRG